MLGNLGWASVSVLIGSCECFAAFPVSLGRRCRKLARQQFASVAFAREVEAALRCSILTGTVGDQSSVCVCVSPVPY